MSLSEVCGSFRQKKIIVTERQPERKAELGTASRARSHRSAEREPAQLFTASEWRG